MKKINFLALLVILFNCRDNSYDDDVIPTFISEYRTYYMEYDCGNCINLPIIAKLKNNGSNYTERKHFVYTFDNQEIEVMQTNVSINGNIITLQSEIVDSNNYYRKEIKIDNGKIIEAIIKKDYDNANYRENDTIQYSYTQNRISTITVKNKGLKTKSYLTYNIKGNLENITTKFRTVEFQPDGTYQTYFSENSPVRIKRIFSNYDNSENPLKNLMIFDEIFYRSLSTNNYRSYEIIGYDEEGNPNDYYEKKNWTLVYDEDGKVNFAK